MTSVRMEIIMQDFRMNTFLAVCQYMNYTHAADALHITQPAVSQHIRYLEKEYGVQLFIQEGKKIRLSEAGELLLDAAQTFRHNEINLKSKMLWTKTGMDISHDIMFIYRKKSIYEKMYVKIYEEMRDNPHITTA